MSSNQMENSEDSVFGPLCEKDVPGAALAGRNPSDLKVVELKRWLMCRGASVRGKKLIDIHIAKFSIN